MNFCSECGQSFAPASYPASCGSCAAVHYRNPIPVAVAVVPVVDEGKVVGMVGVHRSDRTSLGANKWAFPGGFLNMNENAPEGASREMLEETQLATDPSQGTPLGTRLSATGDVLLIFTLFPPMTPGQVQKAIPDGTETKDVQVMTKQFDFAFSTHLDIFDLVMATYQTDQTNNPEKRPDAPVKISPRSR